MDCSSPGSSVRGISQAGILEWVAISFSRGYYQSRDRTRVCCIAGRFFTTEPPKSDYFYRSLMLTVWALVFQNGTDIFFCLVNHTDPLWVKKKKLLGKLLVLLKKFFGIWWLLGIRDAGPIPGSGRSTVVGNGNPLQYSCLENYMDRGALQAYSPGGPKESDMTEHTHTHTQL